MKYVSRMMCIDQFIYTSSNQHGDRYKRVEPKNVRAVILSAGIDDAHALRQLTILSSRLNVPLCYDFDDQEAYIEIVSTKNV